MVVVDLYVDGDGIADEVLHSVYDLVDQDTKACQNQ